MNRIRVSRVFAGVLIAFLAALPLTHCSTKSQAIKKEEEKEVLRNRIQEYWKYRIDGKVDKAYQCELPEFRDRVSILEYVQRFKLVRYVEAEIVEIDIKNDEAQGVMKLTYMYMLKKLTSKKIPIQEIERWRRINGVWYHVPENTVAETK